MELSSSKMKIETSSCLIDEEGQSHRYIFRELVQIMFWVLSMNVVHQINLTTHSS